MAEKPGHARHDQPTTHTRHDEPKIPEPVAPRGDIDREMDPTKRKRKSPEGGAPDMGGGMPRGEDTIPEVPNLEASEPRLSD